MASEILVMQVKNVAIYTSRCWEGVATVIWDSFTFYNLVAEYVKCI